MVHTDVCNDVGSFISVVKFPSSLGQVPLFKFQQLNGKIILNNPDPTSSESSFMGMNGAKPVPVR